MAHTTRFFPAFGPLLFGRAPRSTLQTLRDRATSAEGLAQLQSACGPLLPLQALAAAAAGPNSRQRVFSVSVTFWAFLTQVLNPTMPCRQVVRQVQAWWAARGQAALAPNTSAYCQARARLPLAQLETIHAALAARLQRHVTTDQRWRGRIVKIVDGTNISMPDTTANQKDYPQPASQKPGCGFPMLKLVGLFCLASGALLQVARGTLHVHESQLFRQLWQFLQRGDVLLSDRGFCSFATIAALAARGVDCVLRLHQARPADFRCGRRLGPKDRRVVWHKPAQRTAGFTGEEWAALPDRLTLRLLEVRVAVPGFRTHRVWLITTLLDATTDPAVALGELYFQRWSVELHFREIKMLLGMDVLRCQTPALIHKELQLHLIAYNLVRALMQEAGQVHHVPVARLSFKGSLDTLREWADVLHATRGKPRQQAALRRAMLAVITVIDYPSVPVAVSRAPKRDARKTIIY